MLYLNISNFFILLKKNRGPMPEWLMGVDCKSAGFAYAGSNPARLNV